MSTAEDELVETRDPLAGAAAAGTLDSRWVGAIIPREHWHFHGQLLRRYGIVLAPGEFAMVVRSILKGKALLVERRRRRRAIYSVRIPSAETRIFVLAVGPRLITAWPPEIRLIAKSRELRARAASARQKCAYVNEGDTCK